MKILVTGGCGYVGSALIPKLLKDGHKIISVDTKWFGDFLPKNKNLLNLKLDLKDIEKINLKDVEAIIHLASISNDPMAELDKNLSWEISALSTYKLLEHAKKFNVKRFIYASSGSVYGIKKEKEVTENLTLKPISLYNKVKMCTERIILSYKKYMEIFIIRPATVCGYSPRMRLDLTVNILTYSALSKKKITVFGGNQIRPNIHISDLCNLYIFFLKVNKKFQGIYNAGFENKKIIDIAYDVSRITKSKIVIKKNLIDIRSYRLSSKKLLNIGFKPNKSIFDAILEIKKLYKEKKLRNNPRFKSISWLKKII
ncbi:MAG: NAD-dependent epimerase/dehydratase [Acidimicrobiaceae bacterium]|nr:NAD-dependent epimerase/dehydratase [Acidimicrobiaceae bacterium]|tara:strand:- start:4946 stop:5884 length:939 start_codon:yes stop_codon:yes gene_type:complete